MAFAQAAVACWVRGNVKEDVNEAGDAVLPASYCGSLFKHQNSIREYSRRSGIQKLTPTERDETCGELGSQFPKSDSVWNFP